MAVPCTVSLAFVVQRTQTGFGMGGEERRLERRGSRAVLGAFLAFLFMSQQQVRSWKPYIFTGFMVPFKSHFQK